MFLECESAILLACVALVTVLNIIVLTHTNIHS